MSNKLKVGFAIDLKAIEQLEKIPELVRDKALDKALGAAGKIIASRARQLAPDGQRTGNSQKRSKKQASEAAWEKQIKDTITFVVRKRRMGGTVIIGPGYPTGRKAHFNYGAKVYAVGRVQYYWGKPGTTYVRGKGKYTPIKAGNFKQTRNFMKQALDETKDAAIKAFVDHVKTELKNFG
jgi:hypothetical protein